MRTKLLAPAGLLSGSCLVLLLTIPLGCAGYQGLGLKVTTVDHVETITLNLHTAFGSMKSNDYVLLRTGVGTGIVPTSGSLTYSAATGIELGAIGERALAVLGLDFSSGLQEGSEMSGAELRMGAGWMFKKWEPATTTSPLGLRAFSTKALLLTLGVGGWALNDHVSGGYSIELELRKLEALY